ncbi:DUF563 domain-containing protein [Methanonatronarchaeum sp. AMET6-2]|uniref:glycosyltransferase family 61 protein n=1 Tax=Methanonatronarchaeum sp. AMET6-2 TaxID=2933293 RepID=UPI001FF4954C|nr:glycosyltransferase family 61 protein [Methanonatronarchaeum sp. AMET6-2]UOY10289.1 glycosyltransferase family 61 protein [Methanonatronarchaeum sp. AMET6-2]
MLNRTISIANKARRHYLENGFKSLVESGIYNLVQKPIKNNSISRKELKKIASDRGRIWYMDQEENITISSLSDDKLKKEFKSYPKRYSPDQPFICELQECIILGPGAIGFSEKGRLIEETFSRDFPRKSSLKSKKFDFYLRGLEIKNKSPSNYCYDAVFPIISEFHSYYHWMVEYLPKLRFLEHYIEQTQKSPIILVESNPRDFVIETLDLAGYPSDMYKEWNELELQVQNLIVSIHRPHQFDYQNPVKSNYNPSIKDLIWLRERMLSNTQYNKRKNNKIIYISRQEVPSERGRKVVNFKSLIDIIHEFGGESYVLEEMEFEEQVKLFAESGMIIGLHGAGLLNMIFADDPVIVEIFPSDVIKPHFYFIADMMGFTYEPFVSDSKNEELVIDEGKFRDHIATLRSEI